MEPQTKVVYIYNLVFVHDYDAYLFMIQKRKLGEAIPWIRSEIKSIWITTRIKKHAQDALQRHEHYIINRISLMDFL